MANRLLTSINLSDAAFKLSLLAFSCACIAVRWSVRPPPETKFASERKVFELRRDELSLRSASHANETTSSRHAETSLVSCSIVLWLPGGTTEPSF